MSLLLGVRPALCYALWEDIVAFVTSRVCCALNTAESGDLVIPVRLGHLNDRRPDSGQAGVCCAVNCLFYSMLCWADALGLTFTGLSEGSADERAGQLRNEAAKLLAKFAEFCLQNHARAKDARRYQELSRMLFEV